MHFGENQLSPGSIGISPLPTGHPPVLQHWWVRASTRSYPRFTLPMGSSPGFGSYVSNSFYLARPLQTRFRSGSSALPRLNPVAPFSKKGPAAPIHSPDHSTKGTPSGSPSSPKRDGRRPPTACQRRGSEALSSPSRGAFHLSLTVLVHYRWPGVSAPWRVVPPASHRVSRAPWYSGILTNNPMRRRPLRDSHPLRWAFPDPSRTPHPVAVALPLAKDNPSASYNPAVTTSPPRQRFGRQPGSLATTTGLSPPLPPRTEEMVVGSLATARLILLPRGTEMFQFPRCPPPPHSRLRWSRPFPDEGLPHSDSVGSSLACSSPTTFRRAPRPSSAPGP